MDTKNKKKIMYNFIKSLRLTLLVIIDICNIFRKSYTNFTLLHFKQISYIMHLFQLDYLRVFLLESFIFLLIYSFAGNNKSMPEMVLRSNSKDQQNNI